MDKINNNSVLLAGLGVIALAIGGWYYRHIKQAEEIEELSLDKKAKEKPSSKVIPSSSIPDIEDLGFNRPKDPISTENFDEYKFHMFICSGKDSKDWPKNWKDDQGPIGQIIRYVKASLPKFIRITVCDDTSRGTRGTIDVLMFPPSVRIAVNPSELGKFGSQVQVLIKNQSVEDLAPVARHHIYVCCHTAVDNRCGLCGNQIFDLVTKRIAARGANENITVNKCSHVGGHKYAANVLVFPPGDWFGNVCPAHVDSILDYTAISRRYGEQQIPENLLSFHRGRISTKRE